MFSYIINQSAVTDGVSLLSVRVMTVMCRTRGSAHRHHKTWSFQFIHFTWFQISTEQAKFRKNSNTEAKKIIILHWFSVIVMITGQMTVSQS